MKSLSSTHRLNTTALLLVGFLGGCGGGGDTAVPAAAGSSGMSFLNQVVVEPVGASCPAGGVRLRDGVDKDGNGVLSDAETTSTQFVCNGTPGAAGAVGADGVQYLLKTAVEAVGANCPSGGQRIDAGIDTNNDRVLSASEVTSRTYVCNGATGATGAAGASGAPGAAGAVGAAGPAGPVGPAGASLQWVDVTASFAQASSNTGYLADSSTFVSVQLPASPQVGDLVNVSGVGSGGWGVVQNAGQKIITTGVASTSIGAVWTPRDANRYWIDVRSSSDGNKLIAGTYGGKLYTSTDAGATWTPRLSNQEWHGLASSADGVKLVAAARNDYIYTSSDSGVTWTARDSVRGWFRADSSADGTRLLAIAGNAILTSRDSGVTWASTVPNGGEFLWSVASSADGTRLVVGSVTDKIYVSTDGGTTWTARLSGGGWQAVAMSADGMRIYAAKNGSFIYVSSDGGTTWNALNISASWNGMFASADGQRIVAAAYGGLIYTSTDAGSTWVSRESARNWNGIAGSSDATKLVIMAENDLIYSSTASTSVGGAGLLSGSQFESVALQYVGAGVFSVLDYAGKLKVQ